MRRIWQSCPGKIGEDLKTMKSSFLLLLLLQLLLQLRWIRGEREKKRRIWRFKR